MGKEMEKKDYVMDVALKREYSRGYIANMEAAGGSEDRYLARLFGLYYTDNSRISVFGNLNNTNETRRREVRATGRLPTVRRDRKLPARWALTLIRHRRVRK